MKKLALILAPAFLMLSSFGPTTLNKRFTYDVYLGERPIGTYLVDKTEVNGVENLRVETFTSAGLIRKTEHKFVMVSSYDESKLVASDIKTWLNQDLESSELIHWDGNQYIKQSGDELKPIYEHFVTYSSACVYFEEPSDRTSLFYEKYGKDLAVNKIAAHKYEVVLPNGAKEQYTYSNGEVVQVDFVQSFATITLRVKNS